jgi:hypothetical protein
MSIRTRKLIGTIALLALLTGWTIVAMVLAFAVARLDSPLVSAVYYVAAGMGWALPAMPLISWMSRPDVARH